MYKRNLDLVGEREKSKHPHNKQPHINKFCRGGIL